MSNSHTGDQADETTTKLGFELNFRESRGEGSRLASRMVRGFPRAAEPTPDDVKSVTLELVDKPARRNPWRPTTLTIRVFIKICHHIEHGFSIPNACEVESISYRRFRERVANSLRLAERLKEAETVRFNFRHEQALESVMAAGERSWMAHAWWLERCLPHLYALRSVNRDSGDIEEQPLDWSSVSEPQTVCETAFNRSANLY
jgi:hypothetical protein